MARSKYMLLLWRRSAVERRNERLGYEGPFSRRSEARAAQNAVRNRRFASIIVQFKWGRDEREADDPDDITDDEEGTEDSEG